MNRSSITPGRVASGLLGVALVAALAQPAYAASPSRAGAVSPSIVVVSAADRTCTAFRAWNARRTTANLDAMMTVSEAAPWKYVGEDAAGLYSDVRSGPRAAKYVARDVKYFTSDCRYL